MTLYHVTSKEKLDSIMAEGLIPLIGENSKRVGEFGKHVYLCSEDHVGYWKIILGRKVVLRVNVINESDLKKHEYGLYDEYMYDWNIPPENIELSDIKTSKQQIQHLCYSYVVKYQSNMCQSSKVS